MKKIEELELNELSNKQMNIINGGISVSDQFSSEMNDNYLKFRLLRGKGKDLILNASLPD